MCPTKTYPCSPSQSNNLIIETKTLCLYRKFASTEMKNDIKSYYNTMILPQQTILCNFFIVILLPKFQHMQKKINFHVDFLAMED